MPSTTVIIIGRALLGEDDITVKEQITIIQGATLAELRAAKIILEQYHTDNLYASVLVDIQIRIKERAIIRPLAVAS